MNEEKFLGCMYGLAIGDALGFPTEFLKLPEIKGKYGEKGIKDFQPYWHFPPGVYSDDTQMSLALAKAIIKCDNFEIENFMQYVKEEFVAWSKSEDNNRAPGEACMIGCENMEKGIHWSKSGDSWSKGCGANMRISPLGLVFSYDQNKLFELAHATSICTHGNPTGVSAGIGTAFAVSLAFKGVTPEKILEEICRIPAPSEEYLVKIRQVRRVLNLAPEEAIPILGEGWVAEEALAIAIYLCAKFPNDYKKAVLTAANTNGDSDSLACITGALSGAYNGVTSIQNEWIEKVENTKLLHDISNKLHHKYLSLTRSFGARLKC